MEPNHCAVDLDSPLIEEVFEHLGLASRKVDGFSRLANLDEVLREVTDLGLVEFSPNLFRDGARAGSLSPRSFTAFHLFFQLNLSDLAVEAGHVGVQFRSDCLAFCVL